jgi:hypothetical protein
MTAARLLPRAEWEARLRKHGCKPLGDDSEPRLETGEWWLTKHDFLFSVACDGAGNLRLEDWQHVLIVLARLKPLDWNT